MQGLASRHDPSIRKGLGGSFAEARSEALKPPRRHRVLFGRRVVQTHGRYNVVHRFNKGLVRPFQVVSSVALVKLCSAT